MRKENYTSQRDLHNLNLSYYCKLNFRL